MTNRAALIAMAAAFSVVFYFNAYLCDDAFFSFRAADNLVRGYGLRWNVDERVQVFTNPLHTLAFAAAYWFSHDRSPVPNPDRIYFTSMFLSYAVSLFALLWLARKAQPLHFAPFFLLLLSSQAFVTFTSSGLETPWIYLFSILFYREFLWGEFAEPRDFFRPLLWASLAVVTRLDTALLFLPACAHLLVRGFARHGLRLVGVSTLAALPIVAWFAFALVYYGFLLPNSYYAKIGLEVDPEVLREMGRAYFGLALRLDPITPLAMAAGVALSVFDRRTLLAGLGILLYSAYVFGIGGDFIGHRFLAAPFLVSVLVLLRVAEQRQVWRQWPWLAGATALLLVYGALTPSSPLRSFRDGPAKGDVRFYFSASSLARWRPGRSFPFAPFVNVESEAACREMRNIRARASLRGGGLAAYCGGPEHHAIVPAGIANPLLARLPVRIDVPFLPGHVFKPIPRGYLESFGSGRNLIEDARLAAYFDELRSVTAGPLFSAQRWRAIWELNFTSARRFRDPYLADRPEPFLAKSLVDRLRDLEEGGRRPR